MCIKNYLMHFILQNIYYCMYLVFWHTIKSNSIASATKLVLWILTTYNIAKAAPGTAWRRRLASLLLHDAHT